MKLFKGSLIPVLLVSLFLCGAGQSQDNVPLFKNTKLGLEVRVENLLLRLTPEEKIDLLGGTGFATQPLTRFGITDLRMTDGPLGVRWGKATAFPAGIALASTWDPALVENIGKAIGREVKAKGRHVILGPCVNIARIPQGGRNFESYGEDPFLASRMAVPYIVGVQSQNVAATVKHFACNNQEYERDFVDVKIDERALNEIYLPAFKAAVQEAGVLAVMCSYNKVNGFYASENDYLLNQKLKKEWAYKYLVMSDWGAVHSSIPVANGGLDLEMPTGVFLNQKNLTDAIKSGVIKQTTIDDKVRRILRVMFKLGLVEDPGKENPALLGSKENRKAAFEAERSAIVLLKNDGNILPLAAKNIKSVAVIGPNADKLRAGGGGSSQVNLLSEVSPLQALKKAFKGKIKINFAPGMQLQEDAPAIEESAFYTDLNMKEHGLKGEYFNNMELKGNPVFARVDKQINFIWDDTPPQKGFPIEKYSVRWSGALVVPKTGTYLIQAGSDDGERLYIDNKLVLEDWSDHAFETKTARLELIAGKPYAIRYEFYQNGGAAIAKLCWSTQGEELISDAVNAAKKSDAVLLFVGSNSSVESEGKDRDNLSLDPEQEKLLNAVASANKKTIVVLTSGSPVLMDNWINKVSGIVETWFGGSLMGDALTDVLLGKYNPSGKIPVTFPHRWEDCSAYSTYKMKDSVTEYTDGIYVGYRHFEKKGIQPLFPFGYGLSYTTFAYSGIEVTPNEAKSGDKVTVSFTIKNTGKVAGAEVAQLYVKEMKPTIDRPEKELKGFQKVILKPGEVKKVSLSLDKSAFSFFDPVKKQWTENSGEFQVLVGASSTDIKLNGYVTIK